MNPSPGKWALVSALVHGALAALCLLAPAFVPAPPPEDTVELRLVDVLPAKIIDSAFAGGGGTPKPPQAAPPKAAPPAPVQPIEPKPEPKPEPKLEPKSTPEPKPQPPKAEPLKPEPVLEPAPKPRTVEVAREPVKVPKIPDGELAASDAKEPKKPTPETPPAKPAPRKVEVAQSTVKPSASELESDRKAREQAKRAREEADRHQRDLHDQIARAVSTVRSGASSLDRRLSSTKIEMPSGPGGESYVNYASVLYSIYKPRWDRGRPDAVVENLVVVRALVTIRRDGTVISSRIVQPSGMPAVDKAADRVLKSVDFVAPFPSEVKDPERTFTINFTVEGRTDL